MTVFQRLIATLSLASGAVLSAAPHCAVADVVKVRYPQGSAHGFVEVTTLQGQRLGTGDLLQTLNGNVVTSRLVLHFLDGSLDDETTVFSQRDTFRFISDRHIQRGPSFPSPTDTRVDAQRGLVTVTDEHGKATTKHIDMPPDVYNGMATGMLMNLPARLRETKIAIVIPRATPRIAHLVLKKAGQATFTMADKPRKADDYVVHVELGGVVGVVAPLVGKEPADYHVWILQDEVPAFIREEGQLYPGGPIWRIQQISAKFPD